MSKDGERIARLETEMKGANKRLDSIDEKLDGILEKLDKKYAAKWVEKLAIGLVSFILLSVLAAVMYNVIPEITTNAQQEQR